MSFAQLAPVCSCEQEISGSNPHPCIYYNTFAKKTKKVLKLKLYFNPKYDLIKQNLTNRRKYILQGGKGLLG